MPRLPSKSNVERGTPSPQTGVVGFNPGTVTSMGGAVRDSIEVAINRVEEVNKFEALKSDTGFKKDLLRLQSEFDQREDYGVFEEEYSKKSLELRDNYASRIRDPKLQEQFNLNTDLDIERGFIRTKQLAFDKEKKYGSASLLETLNTNNQLFNIAKTPEERMRIASLSSQSIENAVGARYLDPAQAVKMKQDTAKQFALGELSSMTDIDAIKTLKDDEHPVFGRMFSKEEREKIYEDKINKFTKDQILSDPNGFKEFLKSDDAKSIYTQAERNEFNRAVTKQIKDNIEFENQKSMFDRVIATDGLIDAYQKGDFAKIDELVDDSPEMRKVMRKVFSYTTKKESVTPAERNEAVIGLQSDLLSLNFEQDSRGSWVPRKSGANADEFGVYLDRAQQAYQEGLITERQYNSLVRKPILDNWSQVGQAQVLDVLDQADDAGLRDKTGRKRIGEIMQEAIDNNEPYMTGHVLIANYFLNNNEVSKRKDLPVILGRYNTYLTQEIANKKKSGEDYDNLDIVQKSFSRALEGYAIDAVPSLAIVPKENRAQRVISGDRIIDTGSDGAGAQVDASVDGGMVIDRRVSPDGTIVERKLRNGQEVPESRRIVQ